MDLEEDAPVNPLSLVGGATGRIQKVLTTYVLGKNLYNLGRDWYERQKTNRSYTISVLNTDSIYTQVGRWLVEQIPDDKQHSLGASTIKLRQTRYWEGNNGSRRINSELALYYDGVRVQTVTIDGHKIKVHVSQEQPHMPQNEFAMRLIKEERITFTAKDIAGRNAVIDMLKGIASEQAASPPSLYMARSWGNWESGGNDIPERDINSVILHKDQKEEIVEDLKNFLTAEADYIRLGMPYHRGYLFHGPPGTGKTSAAKALASHMGLDVYYLSLPGMNSDTSLNELLSEIKPRSILLIEDIDIVHGAKDRDDDHKGVSLSGLLNALDGFMTPHGLITIMTTNNLDVLDPALIRPGRIDRIEHIDYVDDWQLCELVRVFLNEHVDWTTDKNVTPAQIVEVILKNLKDKPGALKGIQELI